MLRLDNVVAGYGRTTVLQDLSLEVGDGEAVTVLGRNGVGKSTLLKAIIGAVPVSSGTITLGGERIERLPPHARARRGLAFVPQGREVFPALSVLDNLRVAGYGSRRPGWSERLDRLLDEFPLLAEKRDARAGSLSGGQQQILAVARALMTSPQVLLLDEPSEGIQPSIVDQIGDTIKAINLQRGISVVLVEQNLDFAAQLAERAYLMEKGRVVRELAPAEVLEDRELQREYMGV
jgi:branched-chain amino acid transport system ATP-binding protein/urea transport system ATP-binding protein